MLGLSPEDLMAVLRSAGTERPHPRLDDVLTEFRRRWLGLARRRLPSLGDEAEDAVQTAFVDLLRPTTLDGLRTPALLEQFAGAVFWNKLRTIRRARQRDPLHQATRDTADEDVATRLGRALAAVQPTPEDVASARERLAIVRDTLADLEIARAKFFEGLPDGELAARFAKSNDAIRNHLKRVRQLLRVRLAEGG